MQIGFPYSVPYGTALAGDTLITTEQTIATSQTLDPNAVYFIDAQWQRTTVGGPTVTTKMSYSGSGHSGGYQGSYVDNAANVAFGSALPTDANTGTGLHWPMSGIIKTGSAGGILSLTAASTGGTSCTALAGACISARRVG